MFRKQKNPFSRFSLIVENYKLVVIYFINRAAQKRFSFAKNTGSTAFF